LGERIDAICIVTVCGALAGAFLILGGAAVFATYPSWIDLLAIGSGMAFAANNIVFRATQSVPVASKVTAMFGGCALLIGIYLVTSSAAIPDYPPRTLLLTMAYGIFWLTVITFGTQWGVTRLEAGRASIIIIMELVAAVVSASLLLGETMAAMELVGGTLVVGAVLVETFRELGVQQPVQEPS